MKFMDGVKFGIGVFLGLSVMAGVVQVLNETELVQRIMARGQEIDVEEENKVPIGFHAD